MEEGVVCYADKGGIIGGESQNRKEELEQIIDPFEFFNWEIAGSKKDIVDTKEKVKHDIEKSEKKETEKSQKFTVEKEGNSYRKRV